MKENSIKNERSSIKEDIKDIEKYISFTSKRENFSHDTDWNWNKDLANKIEHILSDYKRVLKENEELLEVKVSASAHNRILELEKENEELKKYKEYYSSARQLVDNNYIQKQKVKEVIKELEDNIYRIKKQYSNGGENCNTVYLENLAQVKILKQILKEVE